MQKFFIGLLMMLIPMTMACEQERKEGRKVICCPQEMSARDWFAAHAFTALIVRSETSDYLIEVDGSFFARKSYELADDMMKEYEKHHRDDNLVVVPPLM